MSNTKHPCNSSDAECDFERMYNNATRERKKLRTERDALVAALRALVTEFDYLNTCREPLGDSPGMTKARAALAKVQS